METIAPKKKNLKKITAALKEGKVLICPTDTVYGLICDAGNKKAVEKIYKIKNRPKSNPLPIFVKDMKMAEELVLINKEQERILNRKWPGGYTFVLKRTTQRVPRIKLYGVNKDTIALRLPKYKFLNDLLIKINRPLAQTSANISNSPATTKIKEVLKQFNLQNVQPDTVINAGDLPKSKPSTIIDLTGNRINILRK